MNERMNIIPNDRYNSNWTFFNDALSDSAKYYVRTQATLGTIAEREATQAADAVFGPEEGSVTLGSMGRVLFHAVLQVNDYLQSVSTESRTRDVTGAELRAGVKP